MTPTTATFYKTSFRWIVAELMATLCSGRARDQVVTHDSLLLEESNSEAKTVSSMMRTCLLNTLYNVCQCCRKLGEMNIPKRVRFGAIIKRNVWKRLKAAFVAFPESHLGAHHPEVCRRRRSWRPGTRSSCRRTGRSLQPEGSQKLLWH